VSAVLVPISLKQQLPDSCFAQKGSRLLSSSAHQFLAELR
jgi:hypothetical protein